VAQLSFLAPEAIYHTDAPNRNYELQKGRHRLLNFLLFCSKILKFLAQK
jgi:cellulose synthase/poly-beta-1,6-N-acetylglucosamine synthase-like glycosyltransferase